MNTATETCPTLEDLACFLEGKLAGKERSRVVSHLADCESCYAVFADAARLQLKEAEEEAAAGEARVIPIRKINLPAWTPSPSWAIPLAAALVVGATAVPLYLRYNRMPEIESATVLGSGVTSSASSTPWSQGDMRGEGASNEASSAAEFLVGAHLVDFRLVLVRNDEAETLNSLSRLHKNFQNFLPVPEEATFYDSAREQILAGGKPADLLGDATRNEESLSQWLAEADSAYLAFGKWVEAGRLSALAEDPDFFDARKNRRLLRWLLRHSEDQDLDAEVVAALGKIRDLVDKSDSPKYPYPALTESFKKILEHYQSEADAGSAF